MLLVSDILPSPFDDGELDTIDEQREWLQTVQAVKVPVEDIIQSSLYEPDVDVYGPSAIAILKEYR